jgi:CDK inhibitor PHO81
LTVSFQVAFELSVVRPFIGSKLEINGQVETYWKASSVPTFTGLSQDHGRQFQPHRPLSIPTSSPNIPSPGGGAHGSSSVHPTPSHTPGAAANSSLDGGLVTATSLTGQYVTVVVQVTKDLVPVVFGNYRLPIDGFEMGVADVTYEQFEKLAEAKGRRLQDARIEGSKGDIAVGVWAGLIRSSMVSLEKMLSVCLPSCLPFSPASFPSFAL